MTTTTDEASDAAETHTVQVGNEYFDDSTGAPTGDDLRTVEFTGIKHAEEDASRQKDGGTDLTLYEVEDGYIVHTRSWSKWQGTTTTQKLKGPFDAKELSDRFPSLARKAGVEVPANLDEVLEK
jgi:hypothetical protein